MKKRFIIWAVLMFAMVFVVNTAGTLVAKFLFSDKLYVPAMRGYSARGEAMLYPTPKEPDEKSKSNGLSSLYLRSLLDDERLPNKMSFLYNFLFLYVDIDQSVIFFDKDGMSEFSNGVYASVYEQKNELKGDDKLSHIRYIVGLIDVRDFCERNDTNELYKTLKDHPDAVLKLNSYSMDNLTVRPAKIIVLDGNGNAIRSFDYDCDGEIINADNIYICNDNEGAIYNDLHGFCNKLSYAYLGERRVDKKAKALVDKVDFGSGDTYHYESNYGFGHYTAKCYEVIDDYSMICVMEFNFITDALVYIVILGIPITLLTFLLGRKKKNEYY